LPRQGRSTKADQLPEEECPEAAEQAPCAPRWTARAILESIGNQMP